MAIKSILFAQGPSFPRLVVSADIFCPKPAKIFFRLKNSAKSSLQNHQSRIWNGKVEVQASDLDLFWRWFQSYCLLTAAALYDYYHYREWSFDFCKTRRIIHNARQKKKNRWCEVFWQTKLTAVCVIVYNKFFTLINLNVHSFEAIIYRK